MLYIVSIIIMYSVVINDTVLCTLNCYHGEVEKKWNPTIAYKGPLGQYIRHQHLTLTLKFMAFITCNHRTGLLLFAK